mgnify:CR=1 FL=1
MIGWLFFTVRATAVAWLLRIRALARRMTFLTLDLTLLGSLIHRVENAKIMLGMLKIGFSENTVACTGRIPPKLKIFLE